jgi:lysophosphatidylcholine acyltransferase/lyso-PAF acetyltransferase
MTEPIKGWRGTFRSSLSYLGRAFFFCLGFHRIKINGKRASKDEARIFVVAPHTSLFDTFVFFALGLPCGVSRIENSLLPLFGLGMKAVQPILVSRESSNKRDDVINEIKKRTSDTSPWNQLYIYPGCLYLLAIYCYRFW